MMLSDWIGAGLAVLAGIGIFYQLVAIWAVGRFFTAQPPRTGGSGGVTVLKPLHGAEPGLTANLASYLGQNYPGEVQLLCGVGQAGDAALASVEELRGSRPDAEISVSQGPPPPGANGKIGNLRALMPLARHDVLVLSDSDIAVDKDYLAHVLGALEQPGVGAVSCLYAGRATGGVWASLDAAIVSYSALGKVVMSLTLGAARPCMGSTIALRRETLDAIGGFARFADVLADDYAVGQAVAELGLKVSIPPILVTHACSAASPGALWRQHLRWAVTIRGVAPLRHIGSGVVHAVPFALLTLPFLPLAGLLLTLAALTVRACAARQVDAIAGRRSAPVWLVPIADCIEFAVYAASLAGRTVHWRGETLRTLDRGRIASRASSASELS